MSQLYKVLLFIITLIYFSSCGGGANKTAMEEARRQAELDSIRLAQKTVVVNTLDPIQKKYGNVLNIAPKKIKNIALYEFIDEWINAPYRMGGETKSGIDCSFFSQYLYHDVFDLLIERTAQKQYNAPSTYKFKGQKHLKQGDLLFFNLEGSEYFPITHVGVYLGHNKFVHSTARRGDDGRNGVQISNLKSRHWQKLFVAAGRKPGLKLTLNNK